MKCINYQSVNLVIGHAGVVQLHAHTAKSRGARRIRRAAPRPKTA
jgi:hypothetical protein